MAAEFIDPTGEGKVAKHPARIHLPVLVAPSTDADTFNTIRHPLIAIGCMKLPDTNFDFDSTLVLPVAADKFQAFAKLRTDLTDKKTGEQPPASVFGHADSQGPNDYNSMLSAHRAAAVYAILTRDVALFDEVRNHSANGVGTFWGDRGDRKMLSLVKDPETGAPYYTPPPEKSQRAKVTSDAIKRFQAHLGQSQTGALTPAQRKSLYGEYMDALCNIDGTPYVMEKSKDFLARGAGDHGKGDYQGCGEINPVMLFSEDEEKKYKDPKNVKERDQKNRHNRRVLVFVFRHGTKIDPKKWPCPHYGQQGFAQFAACKERRWSDYDRREKERLAKPRWFEDHEDTFQCRFYHGIALKSPCEELASKLWNLRMATLDEHGKPHPLPGRRYVVKAGDAKAAAVVRGISGDDGVIPVPMFDEKGDMTLLFDGFGAAQTGEVKMAEGAKPVKFGDDDKWPDEDDFLAYTLAGGTLKPLVVTEEDNTGVAQRLHNLGYGPPKPDEWPDGVLRDAINAWHRLHGHEETGVMLSADRELLREEYGDNVPDPHKDDEKPSTIVDGEDD
jgi:hypothetical protein